MRYGTALGARGGASRVVMPVEAAGGEGARGGRWGAAVQSTS
jgi:hypothetical protein